ncbi:MAG TPA: zf-HC2 domain-containing protein [Methylomirabilota bacterium]|jgi:anti-sigma factor RsiW
MTCRQAIEVLADYLDGTMPPELAADLERHLDGCEPCRAYLATYRKTRALGAAAGRIDMPAEMQTRLRRFLADQLRHA